ncbi:Rrf2 family transcriptional regulator [Streptococcus gallolyticus]|uniref:Rrf2 family transcriptional regulators n=1 Tax=Streptococcus gallolyticus TaxID=315405 RepID=A0AA94M3U2_9STRE|nr:Rrf2 family transcriptional regulator [Streptococcus gallolyticus]AQP42944.1 Rrf2 family transcriptional regulator [Streptococcus gallolyticus subsp. gallolyticus DSM 16831]MCF0238855.1 Rrf2 family transcriptional regulator [Streptococcus gallolyticus]MCQ9216808.1 Rrf2 family transcriptional regulator [Streptococcus gallolyticus]MCY7155921.1 Rrf2 family transcriptional regulator [Streptococcus gallolyticus subsp. gallolyticus]MCY7173289.1 Rrf2 family transcriptional regulator [Streptococcus
MPYSARLSTSVHILLAIYHFENKEKVTSTFLANSIQTNPVIVRNLLGKLQKAELVKVEAGVGGAHLTKSPQELTFWDIFQAVEDKNKPIFKANDDTNPNCPVGRVVNSVLQPRIDEVQENFKASLENITLASLITDMDNKIAQNNH